MKPYRAAVSYTLRDLRHLLWLGGPLARWRLAVSGLAGLANLVG